MFTLSRTRITATTAGLITPALALAALGTLGVVAAPAASAAASAPAAASNPAQQNWLDDQESPVHKYTLAQAVDQAKRFNLISALPGTYAPYVKQMKAANPNLKIVAYTNGTMANGGEVRNAPDSWYLHDAHGNKLKNAWHLFLMDPANPGWIQNRVQNCKDLMRQSGYDGCFLDNLGSGTWGVEMLSGVPIDPATHHTYTTDAWLTRSSHIAEVVREQTGGLIFGNGLVNGSAYFASGAPSSMLFDGSQIACAETFLRTARQGINTYRSQAAWQQDVDMLAQASAQGRSVATIVKVWDKGTTAQIDAWHRFALGSFLLGADGHQYFEFTSSPRDMISDGDQFLPKLAALGRPTGHYTTTGGIYQRSFTGGQVVVNPTSGPLTVHLDKTYTGALSGWKVSGNLTVAPHQAWFLLG